MIRGDLGGLKKMQFRHLKTPIRWVLQDFFKVDIRDQRQNANTDTKFRARGITGIFFEKSHFGPFKSP